MNKVCKYCGVERKLDEFYKNNKSKDGRAHICAKCSNAYSIKWYSANKKLHRIFKDYPTVKTEDNIIVNYHGIVIEWTKEEHDRLIGIKSGNTETLS